MYKRAFALLTFGFVLALNSASCGPTCPAGQQSCGTKNQSASSSAGASASSESATCGQLTALQRCMTAYCKSASNPYCSCYKRGYDLTIVGCKCIDFDAQSFCDQAEMNGLDGSSYDCGAASSGVSSYCVGVQ